VDDDPPSCLLPGHSHASTDLQALEVMSSEEAVVTFSDPCECPVEFSAHGSESSAPV
jgi:hypothetical protein